MARTFMIHVLLHLGEQEVDDILLWSLAIKYEVYTYNRVKKRGNGLKPMDLLTRTKTDHKYFICCHV